MKQHGKIAPIEDQDYKGSCKPVHGLGYPIGDNTYSPYKDEKDNKRDGVK